MGTKKKRLLKEIRRASTLLPVYLQPTKVRVTGKEILEKNPNAKAGDGTAICADKIYLVDAQAPVNHTRKMKKLLREGGANAVDAYIMQMAETANRTVKSQTEIASGIQERMNRFSI